ncbi:hypothetical protein PoMZ_09285 [Pyricularia oryzae]|uniref:Uncharacterized protein n=1 Tax=Pyricularia oryzae TaxID=318829 RepID=A0A4P7MTN2_PYROR|nr:hypothetical protein PoMZ_09285 [Pyricularia oryzae]
MADRPHIQGRLNPKKAKEGEKKSKRMKIEHERYVTYGGRPVRRAYTAWVKESWEKGEKGQARNET